MTLSSLPRIIRFEGCTDSGEFGNATCPHCGADGRYVYHFVCEDGERHGAMAGCIKLYPVSPIANVHRTLIEKQRKLKGETWPDGKPKTLNSWDTAKLEAIEKFYAGEIDERSAELEFKNQDYLRNQWMQKKGYRR